MVDLYARVKRTRSQQVKRDMYGMPVTDHEEEVEEDGEEGAHQGEGTSEEESGK